MVHRERGWCELGMGGRKVWVTVYKGLSGGCCKQELTSEEVAGAGPRLGQWAPGLNSSFKQQGLKRKFHSGSVPFR